MSRTRRGRTARKRPIKKNQLPIGLILAGMGVIAVAAIAGIILNQNEGMAGAALSGGAPSISVNQDFFDYGDVRLGEWIHTTVLVENTGSRNLVFSEPPFVELKEGC